LGYLKSRVSLICRLRTVNEHLSEMCGHVQTMIVVVYLNMIEIGMNSVLYVL